MIYYHMSPKLIDELSDQCMFFSGTFEEAKAWPDTDDCFVYQFEIDVSPVYISDVELQIDLASNPTAFELEKLMRDNNLLSFHSFDDYDPRDFQKDTIAFICYNPKAAVKAFKLIS